MSAQNVRYCDLCMEPATTSDAHVYYCLSHQSPGCKPYAATGRVVSLSLSEFLVQMGVPSPAAGIKWANSQLAKIVSRPMHIMSCKCPKKLLVPDCTNDRVYFLARSKDLMGSIPFVEEHSITTVYFTSKRSCLSVPLSSDAISQPALSPSVSPVTEDTVPEWGSPLLAAEEPQLYVLEEQNLPGLLQQEFLVDSTMEDVLEAPLTADELDNVKHADQITTMRGIKERCPPLFKVQMEGSSYRNLLTSSSNGNRPTNPARPLLYLTSQQVVQLARHFPASEFPFAVLRPASGIMNGVDDEPPLTLDLYMSTVRCYSQRLTANVLAVRDALSSVNREYECNYILVRASFGAKSSLRLVNLASVIAVLDPVS